MKTLQVCIVLVLSLSGNVLAQSGKQAEMIDSIGKVPVGDSRGRFDNFLSGLASNSDLRGYVVIFGNPSENLARRRLLENHMLSRRFDATRVTFSVGGSITHARYELWAIPKGAEPPKIEPEACIEAEFGKVTKRQSDNIIGRYFKELANFPNSQAYIVNYGSDREIAKREKWITSAINFRKYDRSRITLVRGGNKRPPSTVMWIVPPGAALPPA